LLDRDPGRIGLGTAPLAFRDVARADAVASVRGAIADGVRLLDTALAYTRPGVDSWAEEVVRDALAGLPTAERPIVATKGGHWREGDGFPVDGSPERLRGDCAASLRTLDIERIDLYFLHHVDPAVPLIDSVAALAELRDDGLIAGIGLSNVSIDQLEEARAIAPIAAVQNRLSVLDQSDVDLARRCHELGVAYLAYQPFAGGGGAIDGHPVLARIAAARGVSPHQVALAWLASVSPTLVTLVGATRRETIRDSLASVAVTLDPAEVVELTAAR
jgi:aryl-alcohol dehydrogenase-like predicted oxidoreductase